MWRGIAILGAGLLCWTSAAPSTVPVAASSRACPTTTSDAADAVRHQLDELDVGGPLSDALDGAALAWLCAHPDGPVHELSSWIDTVVPGPAGTPAQIEIQELDDRTLVALWQHPDAVGAPRLSVLSRREAGWQRSDAVELVEGDRATIAARHDRRVVLFWEYYRSTGATRGGIRVGRVDAGRFGTELLARDLHDPAVTVEGDTVRVAHLRPPRSFGGGGKFGPSVPVALWLTLDGARLVTRATTPLSPIADLETYCGDPARFRAVVPARVAWQLGACRFDAVEVTEESFERTVVELRRYGCDDLDTLVLERSGDRYLPAHLDAWCSSDR